MPAFVRSVVPVATPPSQTGVLLSAQREWSQITIFGTANTFDLLLSEDDISSDRVFRINGVFGGPVNAPAIFWPPGVEIRFQDFGANTDLLAASIVPMPWLRGRGGVRFAGRAALGTGGEKVLSRSPLWRQVVLSGGAIYAGFSADGIGGTGRIRLTAGNVGSEGKFLLPPGHDLWLAATSGTVTTFVMAVDLPWLTARGTANARTVTLAAGGEAQLASGADDFREAIVAAPPLSTLAGWAAYRPEDLGSDRGVWLSSRGSVGEPVRLRVPPGERLYVRADSGNAAAAEIGLLAVTDPLPLVWS